MLKKQRSEFTPLFFIRLLFYFSVADSLRLKLSISDYWLPSYCAKSHNVCLKHKNKPLEEESK